MYYYRSALLSMVTNFILTSVPLNSNLLLLNVVKIKFKHFIIFNLLLNIVLHLA